MPPTEAAANEATHSARNHGRGRNELALTAYHEAGHAIMAMRHGYWTEYLTIEKHDDALGAFRPQAERGAADQFPTDETIRRWMIERTDILLGGWLAEYRYDPAARWAHSMRDLRRMVLSLAPQVATDQELQVFVRDRTADVTACFNDERMWGCVELLANALLANRTLNGKVLHKLMWNLRCRLDGQTYLGPTGARSPKIDALASTKREIARDYDIIYGLVAALCAVLLVVNLLVLSQCSV